MDIVNITTLYFLLFAIVSVVGDLNLTLAMNQWAATLPSWCITAIAWFTNYSLYIFRITCIVIAGGVFYSKKFAKLKRFRNMFLGAFCGYAISSIITGVVLKPLVGRLRPNVTYPALFNTLGVTASGFSFPSGHATSAFGLSGALMVRVKNWIPRISFLVYAITLSLTRPFFGLHYMTDILAGSIIGLAFSVGFYFMFEILDKKGKLPEARQKRVFLVLFIVIIISILVDILF